VPENKLANLKAGQLIDVETWDSKKILQAKVRDISGSADAATRTFVIKAALQSSANNPADAAETVLGTTVTVRLKPSVESASKLIKVPSSALRHENAGTSVWVLNPTDMTVSAKPIEVSAADGNDVVVKSGLQQGDQVVTSGVHVLTAGQKVSIFGAKQ
jgi:RND family efflux transporter MFP subunit